MVFNDRPLLPAHLLRGVASLCCGLDAIRHHVSSRWAHAVAVSASAQERSAGSGGRKAGVTDPSAARLSVIIPALVRLRRAFEYSL